MRIKIDLFLETVLLQVQQEVTERSVAVLWAGLKKYVKPEVKWIFADFSQAEFDRSGLQALKNTLEKGIENSHPNAAKLVIIGSYSDVCRYPTLIEALASHPIAEGALFMEKISLQDELEKLKERKRVLESLQLSAEDKEQGKLGLFYLNQALKSSARMLTSEVKKGLARVSKLKLRLKSSSEDLQALRECEEEILRSLKEKPNESNA